MSEEYIGKLIAKKDGKRWILGMIIAQLSSNQVAYRVEWYHDDQTKLYRRVYLEHDIKRMLATYKQKVYDCINEFE